MQYNPQEDYIDELQKGNQIAIMPVSRLVATEKVNVGNFTLYPAKSIEFDQLRTIPTYDAMDELEEDGLVNLSGQEKRWASSNITGISIEKLDQNTCICFPFSVDWFDDFLSGDHQTDIEILTRLSAKGERLMDAMRFAYSRLDIPGTWPGPVGSWDQSEGFTGGLLYDLNNHESYLIAGEAVHSMSPVRGVGLQVSSAPFQKLPSSTDGEVGGVFQHALRLLSDVFYSQNDTSRFIKSMALFEFLASPGEYQKMQDVKTEIASHIANTKSEYHDICHRFRELSSIIDNGKQKGYRTRIIHHGDLLEEIIPSAEDRLQLFGEIQRYLTEILTDMEDKKKLSMKELANIRSQKRKELGV